nr:MAG TPA: hypothetical protein [Caudoviricetes sp.]
MTANEGTPTPPHQGGGIATRPASRHLRERQGANGKTNVPPKPCSVFARRRSVGSIPTFRTRGAQSPAFVVEFLNMLWP